MSGGKESGHWKLGLFSLFVAILFFSVVGLTEIGVVNHIIDHHTNTITPTHFQFAYPVDLPCRLLNQQSGQEGLDIKGQGG